MALERMERPGSGPTLVLLHGLGADERDLFDLADLAPEDWGVVSFRAPLAYGGGYSWFDIDWSDEGLRIDVDGAKRAAALLMEEIADLDRPVAMGFSQGAMLVWLALLAGAPFRAGAMFSGAALADGRVEVPTLVVHGRHDPVVPVEFGRALANMQGAAGRYVETDDGHGIGVEAQSAFREWLREV